MPTLEKLETSSKYISIQLKLTFTSLKIYNVNIQILISNGISKFQFVNKTAYLYWISPTSQAISFLSLRLLHALLISPIFKSQIYIYF